MVFFIKDQIDQVDVEVGYYPTEEMWSDVSTNLKQRKDFIELMGKLMNMSINYDDKIDEANMSHLISGVEVEGEKVSNTGTKGLS